MVYKVIDKADNVLGENLTLGQAFTCIDNWCKDNNGNYGLGSIFHVYDNQIGVAVYTKNNSTKLFSIVYN